MPRPLRPLAVFVVVTFAVTWGWDGTLALLGLRVRPGDGWPTHVPGQFGPLLGAAAACLVTGRPELAAWARRLVTVRGPRWLWLSALLLPIATFTAGALAGHVRPRDLGRFSGLPAWPWPLTLLALLVVTGLAEEGGWRGWLLPRLVSTRTPLAAATVIGGIWALWHAPMFFTVQNYRAAGPVFVPIFVISLWCGSVVLTWLWLRSGGSTLLVILWHGMYDLLGGSAASGGAAGLAVNVLVDTAGVTLAITETLLRRRGHTLFASPDRSGVLETRTGRGVGNSARFEEEVGHARR